MKRSNPLVIIIVIAGTIAVAMLLGWYGQTPQTASQILKRRVEHGNTLTFVRAFEAPFNIAGMQCRGPNLYVYDASEKSIVLLDSAGKGLRRWGRKGAGEGEFQLIHEWDVDSNAIYAVDARNLSITTMDHFGKVTSFYRLSFPFVRAYHLRHGRYIFKVMDVKTPRRQVFRALDTSNDSSWSVQFEMPMVENDMSLDGVFVKGARNRGFYVCHKAGYFLAFEEDGRFLYLTETIDRTPPPKIIEEGVTMRMEAGARSVNISACTWREYLFILSRAVSPNDTEKEFVDVYLQVNGEYISSFPIPVYDGARPTTITTDQSGLYALQGLKVVYYRLHGIHG